MLFQENSIFHIYNQGNNRKQVFFTDDHYKDFLFRMRRFLSPHVEFLCYCLMPNHFHFLVYVRQIDAPFPRKRREADGTTITISRSTRTLNKSIAILLRSYSNYLNKIRGTSGSNFRQKTKAKENWIDDFVTIDSPAFFGGGLYAQNCFHYIHKNPMDIPTVHSLEDWAYSSYLDYTGDRKGTLCNQELAAELLGFQLSDFRSYY